MLIKLTLAAYSPNRERFTKEVLWPIVPRKGDTIEYDPENMGTSRVHEVWHFPFMPDEPYLIEVKFFVRSNDRKRFEALGWRTD